MSAVRLSLRGTYGSSAKTAPAQEGCGQNRQRAGTWSRIAGERKRGPGVFRGSDLAGDHGRRSFASDSGRIPKTIGAPAPPRQPPRLRGCDRAGVHRTAVMARSCPAPGSHPSTNRLEPAPPSAGPLSLGLPIQRVLAAPRFALSPILSRNALAFHRVTGSRRGLLYPLSCGGKSIVATKQWSVP